MPRPPDRNHSWGREHREFQNNRERLFPVINDELIDEKGYTLLGADRRPESPLQALMECAPGQEPAPSQDELLPLREALSDAFDELDLKEQWVLDALIQRGLSIRSAAAELKVGKTELCRIRDMALAKLRAHLRGNPIVEEHLDPSYGPRTWEAALDAAADQIRQQASLYAWKSDTEIILEIRKIIDELAFPYFTGLKVGTFTATTADEVAGFTRIGVYGMNGVSRNKGKRLSEIVELVTSKQHDYGHGNIAAFGMQGILVRLSDKCARLENLVTKGTEARNEALVDSWHDIVGYALIGLMWTEGTFMLELADDRIEA